MIRTREQKIQWLADQFLGANHAYHGRPMPHDDAEKLARTCLGVLFPPLESIERDEQYDRTYIPMLGGFEVQTKGKGSTFRVASDEEAMPMTGSRYEHAFLTDMAYQIRKFYGE